jgi:hypothetical protein
MLREKRRDGCENPQGAGELIRRRARIAHEHLGLPTGLPDLGDSLFGMLGIDPPVITALAPWIVAISGPWIRRRGPTECR